MLDQEVKFELIEKLKQRGTYHVSVNGKQHYTRCPYCGDSRNLSHAHLSIKIDTDTDDIILYRCLKCNVSGLVDETVLSELDIFFDQDSMKKLRIYNKKSMRLRKVSDSEHEKFIIPIPTDNHRNWNKLSYLNDRLGTSIGLREVQDLKIIPSLSDFLTINELAPGKDGILTGVELSMLGLLERDYIGFLSCNNNRITFRDITGKNKLRYYKVILNEKNLNSDSFFALPLNIPLMYTNDVHIHVAEGPFDILSIKENLVKTTENNFYYAVCGFGGSVILQYLIRLGINTGLNLHVYCDSDKPDYVQKKQWLYKQPYLTEWVDRIYLHRNTYQNEKDYGVPVEKIIDVKNCIK